MLTEKEKKEFMKKGWIKKKYSEKDYQIVLNHLLESWSSGTMPDEKRMLKDLKKNKNLMDEEYAFIKDMQSGEEIDTLGLDE